MEQETATLILNTFDINSSTLPGVYQTTVDNEYGTIANNRCNLTWKNINMRRVLGEMYDKYETFNMYLYQINQSQALSSTAPTTAQMSLVDVRIKELQFLNNTYNVVRRNNTDTAFLTSYILNNAVSSGAGTVTPMFNPAILTFGKSTECVDINIDMKTVWNNGLPAISLNTAFGTFVFMFKFYGIPTREKYIITNGARLTVN